MGALVEEKQISADSINTVLVTSSFPISGDGSEAAGSFVEDLAEELSRHGSCRVVAPGRDKDIEVKNEKLSIFRYRAPDRPLSTLKPWDPRDIVAIGSVFRAGRSATLDAVAAGPTDRIIALWALPCGLWARALSRRTGIPYTVWALGSDIWSLGKIAGLRSVIRRVLSDANSVFADGIQLAEATRRIGRCEVEFLPSTRSIDQTKARSPRAAPPYRLAFLGRWHRNKGVDLLLEALEGLDSPDWARIESFRIHGGGPLEAEVARRANALIDAGHPIQVGGYLDKASAETLIAESDWLVLPSRIESIPVIFSDAIKLHTPVVATPVGDLPELLQKHTTGILCASASAEGLQAGIRAALQSSAKTYIHGMGALSQSFSFESNIVPALLRD